MLRRPVPAGRICAGVRRNARPRRRRDAQWLARASQAARSSNYVGTIVYQHRPARRDVAPRASVRRTASEFEKLVSLDGPAREVIRNNGEVRCYYPGREARPRRAAHVPQRVPVAVARAAAVAVAVLRVPRRRRAIASVAAPVAGRRVRAEGRPALRPPVLVRRRHRPAAEGAHAERARRGRSSSSRSPT